MKKKTIRLTHGNGHNAASVIKLLEKFSWDCSLVHILQASDGSQVWVVRIERDEIGAAIAKNVAQVGGEE